VAKVKKVAGVTGRRNVKSSKRPVARSTSKQAPAGRKGARGTPPTVAASSRKGAKQAPTKGGGRITKVKVATSKGKSVSPGAKSAKGKKMTKAQLAKARLAQLAAANAARAAKAAAAAAAVQYAVKPLDPQRKCGPGTSVQFLYRVDERTVDNRNTTHLVFFDRHGWYCEHGRTCPAVGHARKYNGQIARAS
jgi:hypothetical protein